uniref:SH2 domain-containing protein n=1 Tax=Falco tinnunculus TaxID=100819 RepID=A0A8C4XNW6_FALTI
LDKIFPFFHGKITKRACEDLLTKNGRNGSYLIRESESVEGALCLYLIYTYRIFRDCKQTLFLLSLQTSEGVPERRFRTLKDLIYTYEKPNQGLITNLRYPLKKPNTSRRNLGFKSGKDDLYDVPGIR